MVKKKNEKNMIFITNRMILSAIIKKMASCIKEKKHSNHTE